MRSAPAAVIQERACEAIEGASFDFTAKFYAALDLSRIAQNNTNNISPRAIGTLKELLLSTQFQAQRQRRFLFREAASILAVIVQLAGRQPPAQQAYDALLAVMRKAHDQAHLAAAEALGALPLMIRGPRLAPLDEAPVPTLNLKTWLLEHHLPANVSFSTQGRSLTARLPDRSWLVVKMARTPDEGQALRREVQWMHYLATVSLPRGIRFEIPAALTGKGAVLFRLDGLPESLRPVGSTDQTPSAIGFIASPAYYDYPNCFDPADLPVPEDFVEIMGRSAFLFGYLAGRGVVHEAPIPLFHNRVQQERRRDNGAYEWFRAGRLDRWLASCAYPNFGKSGLRDFEHFTSFCGKGLALFREIGNHLISLLLVAASYFRARDPQRVGWNTEGEPVDARDLFDAGLLSDLVAEIFNRYHEGFTGEPAEGPPPFDVQHLVRRMIAEMGVDRYMIEYLRVVDQRQMAPEEFEIFLVQRGYDTRAVAGLTKGADDLLIHTGPHLGDFNRAISLPEMIEAAASMAAVCVAKRFFQTPGNLKLVA